MQTQTKTPQKAPAPAQTPVTVHHPARTIFASLFGMMAVLLVLSSLVLVWLNRTLTDTNTYVSVVAPLATKPAIQDFIAQEVSQQVVKNAPTQDLTNALLPTDKASGQSPDQLKTLLQPLVYNNILKVVQAPSFAKLWKDTNQTAHAQLIKQLSSTSPTLDLDLHPVLVEVVNQLKTTQLGIAGDQIPLDANAGKISLKDTGIDKARQSYRRFQETTVVIVVVTLVCLGLSILISVHHLKTTRRILVGTGLFCLLIALFIQLPALITISGNDPVTQKAVVAIEQTLLHNLQVTALAVGVGCLVVAVGSKIYQVARAKK